MPNDDEDSRPISGLTSFRDILKASPKERVLTSYERGYKMRYRIKPALNAAERTSLGDMVPTYGEQLTHDLIAQFFKMDGDNDWFTRNGHSVRVLTHNISQINAALGLSEPLEETHAVANPVDVTLYYLFESQLTQRARGLIRASKDLLLADPSFDKEKAPKSFERYTPDTTGWAELTRSDIEALLAPYRTDDVSQYAVLEAFDKFLDEWRLKLTEPPEDALAPHTPAV